jgi:hypothetical protein
MVFPRDPQFDRCRWHKDTEVPGGRYLVPGCWNRAIYGDDAECQCIEHDFEPDLCPTCGQAGKSPSSK